MRIRLRFFAAIREAMGTSERVLELAAPPRSLAELLAALDPGRACTALFDPRVRAAVNGHILETGSELRIVDGDEIALLPPVTGG